MLYQCHSVEYDASKYKLRDCNIHSTATVIPDEYTKKLVGMHCIRVFTSFWNTKNKELKVKSACLYATEDDHIIYTTSRMFNKHFSTYIASKNVWHGQMVITSL